MLTLKPHKKLTFDHVTDTYALGIVIDDGEHVTKNFEEISALSHRVLNQLIKDHFRFKYCQKHKGEPFIKLIENSRTASTYNLTLSSTRFVLSKTSAIEVKLRLSLVTTTTLS